MKNVRQCDDSPPVVGLPAAAFEKSTVELVLVQQLRWTEAGDSEEACLALSADCGR